MDLVEQSRKFMLQQTRKNKAPAWLLTELAVRKGRELAKRHGVDPTIVAVSLYLTHIIFSPVWKGAIQKKHPKLSAELARKQLKRWHAKPEELENIVHAIEAHHRPGPDESRIAEVVKNAECYKFVTVEGALIYLHELGMRHIPFAKAVAMVLEKMEQKSGLLTLSECIQDASVNCSVIRRMLAFRTPSG